jgi:hypothetical protein
MPEPTTVMGGIRAVLGIISAAWNRGAILLWSCAAASFVAFVVLIAAKPYDSRAFELRGRFERD